MYWIVTFNDGEKTTVTATWIIDAIVNACIHLSKNYTDVVSAHHMYERGV